MGINDISNQKNTAESGKTTILGKNKPAEKSIPLYQTFLPAFTKTPAFDCSAGGPNGGGVLDVWSQEPWAVSESVLELTEQDS